MQQSVSDTDTLTEDLLIPVSTQTEQRTAALTYAADLAGMNAADLERDFSGKAKATLTLYTQRDNQRPRRIYLLGVGEMKTVGDVLGVARSFVHKNRDALSDTLGIHLAGNEAEQTLLAEGIANGAELGTYVIGRYQTASPKEEITFSDTGTLTFFPKELSDEAKTAIERGRKTGETQTRIMDLVNAPANKKNPQDLAAWARSSGAENGFEVTVFDKAKCEEIGLHGLLAVNRGSEYGAQFVIMEYRGEGGNLPKIGLVGKGVTFDTGGVSIKPSTNLHFMKSDMGGSAAVLGAMELTAKLQLPVHLIGICGFTDNSVDAKAIKPSDVIGSYSGKNIEIIDTDAEGRLTLADGLNYMVRHYAPETLLDLATLTGSSVRALGYLAGALMTKNDDLREELRSAGDATGERLWPLPLWDSYGKYIESDVADVKNYSGMPVAGAITAGKFLEHFVEDHPRWAHLDIAGVAIADGEFSKQRSATAFGVRLLVEWLRTQKP